MRLQVLRVIPYRGEYRITVRYFPGWLKRLLGYKAYNVVYQGQCTVWHDITSGRRAGTQMESQLADYLWKYKNG